MSFSKDFMCDTFSLILYTMIFIERAFRTSECLHHFDPYLETSFYILCKGSQGEVDTTKKMFSNFHISSEIFP